MPRFLAALALAALSLHAQSKTPADSLKRNFDYINNKVLEMAQDFPADKYNYKLKPEMRTFGAVIVHIASGDIYAGKAGMGEKVKWDDQEQDPSKFSDQSRLRRAIKEIASRGQRGHKSKPRRSRQESPAVSIRAPALLRTL